MSKKMMYVVIFDRNRKLFNVRGPFLNTEEIARRVTKAQEKGKNVIYSKCKEKSKEDVIQLEEKAHKEYDFVNKPLM